MTLASSTLEWVEFAEHDYLSAKALLQVSKVPFEIVAYHCRQLAEKYLKASLIQNGLPVPLIHDLAKLNRLAQGLHPGLKDIEVVCELLTPFGTATRYPGNAMTVGPEHMPSVLGWAESIRQSVRDSFGLK